MYGTTLIEWLDQDPMDPKIGMHSGFPCRFAGVDDTMTNLAKEREPGDIERTP